MTVLHVKNLVVDYAATRALDGADLSVAAGETVGLVGESGSGKSTLGMAIGRLLPRTASRAAGTVDVCGAPVFDLAPRELRELRRQRLGFIFQDPIATLDPTMRVGAQLKVAGGDSAELLDRVRLPAHTARSYPHELSGGMAQRVAVAMAMTTTPDLLIADEPTAALDTQVREEVLTTVFSLAAEAGTSILWLSHDLPAVARRCDRVAVMYGGRVVEQGPAADVLGDPVHPYTAALARSAPARAERGVRLRPVPGRPPVLTGAAQGCAFEPRCPLAGPVCVDQRPPAVTAGEREILCHHPTGPEVSA